MAGVALQSFYSWGIALGLEGLLFLCIGWLGKLVIRNEQLGNLDGAGDGWMVAEKMMGKRKLMVIWLGFLEIRLWHADERDSST